VKTLNIRDKIFEIAGFMGVSMKGEFRAEYKDWKMRQGWEQVMRDIRVRNGNGAEIGRERSVTLELD